MPCSTLSLFLLMNGFLCILTTATVNKFERDKDVDGLVHDNHLSVTTVATVEDCALICSESKSCLSFTFVQTVCHTYNISFFIDVRSQSVTGAHTYKRKQDYTTPNCSDGFIRDNSGEFCYKIMDNETKTWSEALSECMVLQSSLFMLDSDNEKKRYIKILKRLNKVKWWSGGYDHIGQNIDWKWLNGKSVMSHLWKSGEPNSPGERCLEAVGHDIDLNDRKCTVTNHYVCEQSLQL